MEAPETLLLYFLGGLINSLTNPLYQQLAHLSFQRREAGRLPFVSEQSLYIACSKSPARCSSTRHRPCDIWARALDANPGLGSKVLVQASQKSVQTWLHCKPQLDPTFRDRTPDNQCGSPF